MCDLTAMMGGGSHVMLVYFYVLFKFVFSPAGLISFSKGCCVCRFLEFSGVDLSRCFVRLGSCLSLSKSCGSFCRCAIGTLVEGFAHGFRFVFLFRTYIFAFFVYGSMGGLSVAENRSVVYSAVVLL